MCMFDDFTKKSHECKMVLRVSLCTFILFAVLTQFSFAVAAPIITPLDIDISGDCFFVVSSSGDLVAWGNNDRRLIPREQEPSLPYAKRRVILKDISQVSVSTFCALAIDKNQNLYGWGLDLFGQLLAEPVGKDVAILMNGVSSVALGERHALAVTSDGGLLVWGNNSSGQLGLGFVSDEIIPPTELLEGMKSVYAFGDISFAISSSNELYTWGPTLLAPVHLSDDVISVAFMSDNSYQVLRNDGTTFKYSTGLFGGSEALSLVPLQTEIKAICNAGYIKEDNSFWTWEEKQSQLSSRKIADSTLLATVSPYYYSMSVDSQNNLLLEHLTNTSSSFSASLSSLVPVPMLSYALLFSGVSVSTGLLLCVIYKRKLKNQQKPREQ